MKVGMIFECGPQGADKQVAEYLTRQLRADATISPVTLDNKANLLRDAGQAAKQLLADGCCCVLILWDLRPAWPEPGGKPCRHAERQTVLDALRVAGVANSEPVHLVCVQQELESWLLANERAISALLSTDAHPIKHRRNKQPDQVIQPKAVLVAYFKKARGWRYDDKVDAIRVLKASPIDLPRLRQSASFTRFEQKLLSC